MAQVVHGDGHVTRVEVGPEPAQAAAQGQGRSAGQEPHHPVDEGRGPSLQGEPPLAVHALLPTVARSFSRNRGSSSIAAAMRKTSTGRPRSR